MHPTASVSIVATQRLPDATRVGDVSIPTNRCGCEGDTFANESHTPLTCPSQSLAGSVGSAASLASRIDSSRSPCGDTQTPSLKGLKSRKMANAALHDAMRCEQSLGENERGMRLGYPQTSFEKSATDNRRHECMSKGDRPYGHPHGQGQPRYRCFRPGRGSVQASNTPLRSVAVWGMLEAGTAPIHSYKYAECSGLNHSFENKNQCRCERIHLVFQSTPPFLPPSFFSPSVFFQLRHPQRIPGLPK